MTTTANQITIVRLLLIPAFVWLGLRYGNGVERQHPDESLRWAAILVFLTASLTDGLDGYVARRYHQTSKVGAILDAIADKTLLLAALLTLTFSDWGYRPPWWFLAVIFGRDAVVVGGSLALQYVKGTVHVRPRWTGKIATCLQIAVVAWIGLRVPFVSPLVLVVLATVFTILSWAGYMTDGIRQLHQTGREEPVRGQASGILSSLERHPEP